MTPTRDCERCGRSIEYSDWYLLGDEYVCQQCADAARPVQLELSPTDLWREHRGEGYVQ